MTAIAPVAPRRVPGALRWLAVALWMGLIFYMSSRSDSGHQSVTITLKAFQVLGLQPTPQAVASADHLLRKGAHFGEYAVFANLLLWALPGYTPATGLKAWLLATLYAATDEFHQRFVPTRGPSVTDVGIDSCGAAAGLAIAYAGRWLVRRKAA